MELLLAVACFFLWRITKWVKECAMQLMVLNGTANEQRRVVGDGLERIESQASDLNEKIASIQDTTDAYYREHIKPMRGY